MLITTGTNDLEVGAHPGTEAGLVAGADRRVDAAAVAAGRGVKEEDEVTPGGEAVKGIIVEVHLCGTSYH